MEALLVDVIKADVVKSDARLLISRANQRGVLEGVLDRRRARRYYAGILVRPIVAIGLLLAAGVTAATVGHDWIARGLHRTLGNARRIDAIAARPAARSVPAAGAEIPTPVDVEPAPAPAAKPALTLTTQPALKQAPRMHPTSIEDPSCVADALRALRTDHDPVRAGGLLAQYLKTYPRGVLSEEAAALSIEAAVNRKSPSAATFAERYLREYPNGRFRETAEQALARQRQ